jgi:cellobiose-specific phosphotransferase system component IIA
MMRNGFRIHVENARNLLLMADNCKAMRNFSLAEEYLSSARKELRAAWKILNRLLKGGAGR